MLVFGYSPTNGDGNYSTFANAAATLAGAGFVDMGVTTDNGDPIYGGVVAANGGSILATAPPPDAAQLGILTRSINRTRPASTWGIAELVAWAKSNPNAVVYATFR